MSRTSLIGIAVAVALGGGCTNDPTSLGDQDSEGTSTGVTSGDDDPSASGAMDGPTSGVATGAGSGDTMGPTTLDTGSTGSDSTDDTQGGTGPSDAAGVLFVNFDGATLTSGADDATMNQTVLAGSFDGEELAPYGEGPRRAEVLAAVAVDWAAFDVEVTDVRPASGDYAMVVVTPTNPFGGGVLGIASPDCGNVNPSNVGLVFASSSDSIPVTVTAAAVSREAAIGMGLDRVDLPGDLLHATVDGDPSFVDMCAPLEGMAACPEGHKEFCPPGEQNSFAQLMGEYPLP